MIAYLYRSYKSHKFFIENTITITIIYRLVHTTLNFKLNYMRT